MPCEALRVIRLPSASRLELLDFCRYFPNLPWDKSEPGEAAQTGTVIHSMVEQHSLGGPVRGDLPLADYDKARKVFERWKPWWVEYSKGRVFWPEVAVLYDVRTGAARVAPDDWVEEGRQRGEWEVAIVIDAFTVEEGKGILIDWKTGKKQNATPARSNAQLMVGALALSRLFGLSEVEVSLGWLRQRKDPELDTATFDAMDLTDFEVVLKENCVAIGTSEPNPGAWCWKCPAKGSCPARNGPPRDDGFDWEAYTR